VAAAPAAGSITRPRSMFCHLFSMLIVENLNDVRREAKPGKHSNSDGNDEKQPLSRFEYCRQQDQARGSPSGQSP
jgi:hypothetical protein